MPVFGPPLSKLLSNPLHPDHKPLHVREGDNDTWNDIVYAVIYKHKCIKRPFWPQKVNN